jgi:hypothetical protein
MPSSPRNLPHIFIDGGGVKEAYTARGGGENVDLPQRNRTYHAQKLISEIERAVAVGEAAIAERASSNAPAPQQGNAGVGFYVEFAIAPGDSADETLKRLEARPQGIELVAVRAPNESGGATIATVFVPKRSAAHFQKKIERYRDKNTPTGKPAGAALVTFIEAISAGTVQSLFTDPVETFPTNDQMMLWWEVWIRPDLAEHFSAVAAHLEIHSRPHVVTFPERHVRLLLASSAQLKRVLTLTGAVAELRLAKDTPSFFMRLVNEEQRDWTVDLVSRLAPLPSEAPDVVICLLDGGINQQHPLLAPRLSVNDLHTVDPTWTSTEDLLANHVGHGTGMAGLALYGDLTESLIANDPILAPHRLESVKILPPHGANEPDAYGAITLQAIGIAESIAPHRARIVCTAVTSAIGARRGHPSAWSSAIDQAAFDAFGVPRLIVAAAGNVRDTPLTKMSDYRDRCDLEQIENPAQAWNALTVGAITEKANIVDDTFAGWQAVAPPGDLSPRSRTGLLWDRQWPVKPDVVMEGGNYASDGGPNLDCPDDLSLLTTHHAPLVRQFRTFGDTSAACALVARMAAIVAARRPSSWPETIRALIVNSAEWSEPMRAYLLQTPPTAGKQVLLRRYGYGIPSLERAILSATNDLTLVVEESIIPFKLDGSDVKTREMSIHRLPWPRDVLLDLGETPVELRVTLSYFVEPNPGERGWTRRHRYASHGLRFEVKRPLESDAAFRRRVNDAVEVDEGASASTGTESADWVLGPRVRDVGSIHSDIWNGAAADLAKRGAIGVYPVGGWWREKRALKRYDRHARYALIATLRVPDQSVDIYTPVCVQLGIETPTIVDIDVR